jgi:hypothetical protein
VADTGAAPVNRMFNLVGMQAFLEMLRNALFFWGESDNGYLLRPHKATITHQDAEKLCQSEVTEETPEGRPAKDHTIVFGQVSRRHITAV